MTTTAIPTPEMADWTADQLAGFGDRIDRAKRERAERKAAEAIRKRQRDNDQRQLARVEKEIPALEAAIAERQPAVDELERQFDEQKAAAEGMLDDRGRVPYRDVRQYEATMERAREIGKALSQALNTGSEILYGTTAHEVGGGAYFTPTSRRLVHPLLEQVAPNVEWTFPLAPLVAELEKLQAERDKLKKRLEKLSAD